MTHPDLPDNPPVEVPESAYRAVWRARGWQESEPPPDDTTETPEPARDGGLTASQTTTAPAPARKRKES